MDLSQCGSPDCDHDHSVLFLVQRCHPASGAEVHYTKATGVLTIRCKQCEALVAEVMVAAR